MMTRSIVAASVMALALAWGGSASAQQTKCIAGKTKCMAKLGTGLLKCEQLAETPGKVPDPNANGCVDKAGAKFDGGAESAKGCFEKLEGKNPNDCITFDDTETADEAVESCVGAFVEAIDPPPISQTKCGAGKKKCVSKYLKALMKCRQLSQTPGKPTDPNAGGCVDKAAAKYNGGIEPAKGCFAKLEAKAPNDCQFTNDSGTLQGLVESCVADLADLVTTTLPPVELQGALTQTPGRFNYNLTLGLPGANAACNTNFPGTHACTYAELVIAEGAGDLVGLKDIANNTVTSFWAIDNAQPPLSQCQDDVSSFLNWEYATAHTASRGNHVALNNGTGALGTLQTGQQCNFTTKWVGCCL